MKYLYGASVQGIQGFIFQTNELKDIVGASDLIESICTSLFEEYKTKNGKDVINAAGNIKYIFDTKEACEKAVLEFPKKVMESALGITLSQAVEKYDENKSFSDICESLEKKLRIQRNKPMISITTGQMSMRRARTTGFAAVKEISSKAGISYLDAATAKKRGEADSLSTTTQSLCNDAFGFKPKKEEICFNIDEMTGKNDWIAIIHADGNSLGQVVQALGKDEDKFHEFSKKLDEATKSAAQTAYNKIKEKYSWNRRIPIRPIILGGDDFTVVCRGDIALDYAKAYLAAFEDRTNSLMKDSLKEAGMDRLTACAGIAYIKSSYPFYYGYNLVENLCDAAKKISKKIAKEFNTKEVTSSLMFYKVQDSFIESYEKMAKRELDINDKSSFIFGPYFLKGQTSYWTLDDLMEKCQFFYNEERAEEYRAIKAHVRQWMQLMHKNKENAEQKRERVLSLLGRNDKSNLFEELTTKVIRNEDMNMDVYPAYDVLSIVSIMNNETK